MRGERDTTMADDVFLVGRGIWLPLSSSPLFAFYCGVTRNSFCGSTISVFFFSSPRMLYVAAITEKEEEIFNLSALKNMSTEASNFPFLPALKLE